MTGGARGPGESRRAADGGSAGIAVAAVMSACLVVTSATVTVGAALVSRHRAGAAADAAAVAAADAAAGLTSGSPCGVASTVASANRVVVETCSIEGSDATVAVRAGMGILSVRAVATAGQPTGSPGERSVGSKK